MPTVLAAVTSLRYGGQNSWQGNVNILQHLQSDRQSGASTKLRPTDSVLFKQRDKSSSVNFAQYDIMPYDMEIVS